MSKFLARGGPCETRVHCRACRTDAEWRKNVGAPTVCPHDVTLDNLPEPHRVESKAAYNHAIRRQAFKIREICSTCTDSDCPHDYIDNTPCSLMAALQRGETLPCPSARF